MGADFVIDVLQVDFDRIDSHSECLGNTFSVLTGERFDGNGVLPGS